MFKGVSFILAFVSIIVVARAQAVDDQPQHFNQAREGHLLLKVHLAPGGGLAAIFKPVE